MIYQGDAKEYIYDTPGILCKILKNEQAILEESMGFLKKERYRKSGLQVLDPLIMQQLRWLHLQKKRWVYGLLLYTQ